MRSPIYYGTRGFVREINRQRNQYQRSIETEQKKALKEEMYNNGYEFEQKENRRLEKKKQMCFNYAAIMMKQNQIDADKKDFEEKFYEINREIALNKFKKEEKKKQESIEKQNKNIVSNKYPITE